MPGLLIYRNPPTASRGKRGMSGGGVVWPKAGKKREENLPPAQPQAQAKPGFVVSPLQMHQPSQTQPPHQHSDQNRGMDYLAHMMQSRMQADAFIAERSSYLSSGSEHELSSVCLAEMVHDFMEDEPSQRCQCGRARCNCDTGNAVAADVRSSSLEESTSNLGGELAEILKDFMSGVSAMENTLLTDVSKAISYVKEQGIDGIECTGGYFKRTVMKNLRAIGYNAAICKSRWDHAGCFPGGEYDYMDVIDVLNSEPQRLIIDIQFAAQFEIARPTDQYSATLEVLPSIFVGKSDRLLQIINVMSTAVKKSLKNSGMHLPPWRKPEYIKAKWFSSYRRTTKSIGRHLKSREDITDQDFRWGRDVQYEKAEAKHNAVEELGMHDAKVFFKTSEREEQSVFKNANNFQYNGYEKAMMLTNWQPPVVHGRGSSKATVKIAGLASALMEAGLITLVKRQNTKNHENKFPMAANTAAALTAA